MNTLEILKQIQALVWSPPLLILLGGMSLYMTVMLRGLQFRYLIYSLKTAFSRQGNETKVAGELTHFQALMTSLAAAIGTGNIAGVATALATGGMGSLFWMWVIALLGMIIKYCESLLAVKYRIRNANGEMSGGPMYFLARGAGMKKTGAAFALFGVLATIGTGNMVQVNSVADALNSSFHIPPLYTGIALAFITGAVLLKGIRSIGKVAEYFVPVMACLYLLGGLAILCLNLDRIPETFLYIISSAFKGEAAFGGFLGSSVALTIQTGIARGIFSNEAGLGTSSIASAAAMTKEPGTQAMVSMTSAFLSTVIVCTITGLVIGVTGVLGTADPETGRILNGAPMALKAFGSQLPGGEYIVTFGLILFAWSTILGWAYYGEKCLEFLTGIKMIPVYRIVYIGCMIPAALLELESVWTLADITNGLMMIPNLIGIFSLREVIYQETRLYLEKIKTRKAFALKQSRA